MLNASFSSLSCRSSSWIEIFGSQAGIGPCIPDNFLLHYESCRSSSSSTAFFISCSSLELVCKWSNRSIFNIDIKQSLSTYSSKIHLPLGFFISYLSLYFKPSLLNPFKDYFICSCLTHFSNHYISMNTRKLFDSKQKNRPKKKWKPRLAWT